MGKKVYAEERLYVNADYTEIVPEDSRDAAFLLASEGSRVPDKYVHLLSDATDDLSDLTVKELKALADERDVDLTGKTRKADIIAAIEDA